MTTIEHTDLVTAVLASRDAIEPDLETELLEAIVNAEVDAADADSAMHGIDVAVSAAIDRGVGYLDDAEAASDDTGANDGGSDDEGEDEA